MSLVSFIYSVVGWEAFISLNPSWEKITMTKIIFPWRFQIVKNRSFMFSSFLVHSASENDNPEYSF